MKPAPKKSAPLSPDAMGPAMLQREQAPAPFVAVFDEAKATNMPAGRMLISSPLEISAVVARIPDGRVLRMSDLRFSLAKSHKADYTCPNTTGSMLQIVAEASEEERALGRPGVPYWRVVRDDGSMIDSFPGGAVAQAKKLERDGVELFRLTGATKVSDLEHFGWRAPPLGKNAGKTPTL